MKSFSKCVQTPGGITVVKASTQAGMGSCVQVIGANRKDEDILFDIGVFDTEFLSAKHVFVSHSHIDHIGAAITHARMKYLISGSSTYYIPECAVKHLNDARIAFENLDEAEIIMNLKAVSPGDFVKISSSLSMRVFRTLHRVPSQGYALYKTTDGGLDPQYRGLSSQQIGNLRKDGVNVKLPPVVNLELVYTGDTTMAGLLLKENSFIFEAPVLIMEVTYLDGEISKAHKWGHIHLDEIIANTSRFKNNIIVFCHISSRYPLSFVVPYLLNCLPQSLIHRVYVSLKSFGAKEELTPLVRIPPNAYHNQVGSGWGKIGNTKMKRRWQNETQSIEENFKSAYIDFEAQMPQQELETINNISNSVGESNSTRLNFVKYNDSEISIDKKCFDMNVKPGQNREDYILGFDDGNDDSIEQVNPGNNYDSINTEGRRRNKSNVNVNRILASGQDELYLSDNIGSSDYCSTTAGDPGHCESTQVYVTNSLSHRLTSGLLSTRANPSASSIKNVKGPLLTEQTLQQQRIKQNEFGDLVNLAVHHSARAVDSTKSGRASHVVLPYKINKHKSKCQLKKKPETESARLFS